MVAIKAHFDGEKVVLPDDIPTVAPGEVILIFPDLADHTSESDSWMKAQEPAFTKVWENDEDAIYDSM